MIRNDLLIDVKRLKKSFDYQYSKEYIDKHKLNKFGASTKNNMLDTLTLYKDGKIIYRYDHWQTVSNHPEFKHSDTIAPGKFQVKCFVNPGNYNTEIHGIINTVDISGQFIDENAMQWDNGRYIGRFLIHSCYYEKYKRDTRAYSGACFISWTKQLIKLNIALKNCGVKKYDIINGVLRET